MRSVTDADVRASRLGWHSSVPPNGFANRPRTPDRSNSNPLGLDTPRERDRDHARASQSDCGRSDGVRVGPGPTTIRMWLRCGRSSTSTTASRDSSSSHRPRSRAPPVELDATASWSSAMCSAPTRSSGCGRRQIGRSTRCWRSIPRPRRAMEAGGLPHRYSFGEQLRVSTHDAHRSEWVELIDMPTTTPIITAIFGSPNYILLGGGGDGGSPAGAIEYQGLHSDNTWTEPNDPSGRVTCARAARSGGARSTHDGSISRRKTVRSDRSPARRTRATPIPNLARRAGVDETQHGVPGARRLGDLPGSGGRGTAGHRTCPARCQGHAQHGILRPVVPQRSRDPFDAIREVEDAFAAWPAHRALCHVRPWGRSSSEPATSTRSPRSARRTKRSNCASSVQRRPRSICVGCSRWTPRVRP